jgi:hypothetical protein
VTHLLTQRGVNIMELKELLEKENINLDIKELDKK